MGRVQENFEDHDRESLNCLGQIVSRNVDVKNAASVNPERSERHVWYWMKRKKDPCEIVTELSTVVL